MSGNLNLIQQLKGGLIVSCQASPSPSLEDPTILAAIVEAVVAGGATVPLAACTEASELSGAADEGSHNPLLWAVAWQQTAAEFGALCHQAYNVARMRLDLAIGNTLAGKVRVIKCQSQPRRR